MVPSLSLPLLLHFFIPRTTGSSWTSLVFWSNVLDKFTRPAHVQPLMLSLLKLFPALQKSYLIELFFGGPHLKTQKQKTNYLCMPTVVLLTFILHAVSIRGLILPPASLHRNINFKRQNLGLDWVLFVIRANIRHIVGTQ